MAASVRVATINILRDPSRWPARRRLLAQGLAEARPDLIALQEVARPLGASTAHELAGDLGGFEVITAPKVGRLYRGEGIALLSRFPIEDHQVVPLGSEGRVAQFVRVTAGPASLVVGNAHLLVRPWADRERTRQVRRLVDHLRAFGTGASLVACGDFNDEPGSPALIAAARELTSAHAAVHGREPEFTCPTPLRSGRRGRDSAVDLALRLASNRPDGPWRATLDYIFVGPTVRVDDCRIILDRPDSIDSTLYPSDHLGLLAQIGLGGPPLGRPAGDPPGSPAEHLGPDEDHDGPHDAPTAKQVGQGILDRRDHDGHRFQGLHRSSR